jgi:hypothetical protein
VNELQLHSRLSDLADDLAPGDDPFELVAGARALHRRRRRTRIGVAGAALAVALVAVGVPTAMGTLSASDRGDVARPSPSSDPPTGEAVPSLEDQEASRRRDEAVDEGLRALSARPDPRLYARPDSMECRDGTAALSGPLGPELTLVTDRPDAGLMDCAWVSEAAGVPVTVSIRFLEGVDGGKVGDVAVGAVLDSDFHGTETVSAGCYMVPVTVEGVRSSLAACDYSNRMQLVLGIEDAARAGVWVLQADVPPESPLDAAGALDLVVGAAEQAW